MGFVGCSQGALVNRRHNLELEKRATPPCCVREFGAEGAFRDEC